MRCLVESLSGRLVLFIVFAAVSVVLALFLTATYMLPAYRGSEYAILKALCRGSARCFKGIVEDIIDGDTLKINEETIRLSLVNTPEKGDDEYFAAIAFVEKTCPIGSKAMVDEDDFQVSRSHRRIVATVYCEYEGTFRNLNEELLRSGYAELLENFCERSEFKSERWAMEYGCTR
jgi:endonuclease YncB( thermonuclease family)